MGEPTVVSLLLAGISALVAALLAVTSAFVWLGRRHLKAQDERREDVALTRDSATNLRRVVEMQELMYDFLKKRLS